MPAGEWNDDTDGRDRQRRTPDRAQLSKVHLHAYVEQEEDHSELAEKSQDLVRTDETEHRRTDEHAGEDLADDGRNADALRQLGRRLRREQHDRDVDENLSYVHTAKPREETLRGCFA